MSELAAHYALMCIGGFAGILTGCLLIVLYIAWREWRER